jgi:hypothetical protein
MGSTVTAKRMCSMALESCWRGWGFVETLLSVWNLDSPASEGLVALASCVFAAILECDVEVGYNF